MNSSIGKAAPRPKPQVRCYYYGEDRPVVNLGDLLVPYLLDALGYRCVPRETADADVVNPGRCLLVIGSLLTRGDIERINSPLDVWGCGWKGPDTRPERDGDVRYFAVRGPQTAAGLGLAPQVALGDPALLFPHLIPLNATPHGRTVLIPHLSRIRAVPAADRLRSTGCNLVLPPLVARPLRDLPLSVAALRSIVGLTFRLMRRGMGLHGLWRALGLIAGADFVLTGSLHGAILAQAYGVPWAAYHDGNLDAPAKWTDWASYLGVDVEAVRDLRTGRSWWARSGHRGRVPDLDGLLQAFPYALTFAGAAP